MKDVKNKIVVLSGKGGVGKSTVAVNLAVALAKDGKKVGLLDIDIHGPSVPTMLGLEGSSMLQSELGLLPIEIGKVKVVSIGFMLKNCDDPVIWRGPMKANVIKQFLHEAAWDDIDYLVVDCPPGTGDEPLSVCQILENPSGAVIVTTPQQVSTIDVSRSVSFCDKIDLPVLGVIENMSGFICPGCGEQVNIFKEGGGERIAKKYDIPFLGKIPIDTNIGIAGDDGTPFVDRFCGSPAADIFMDIVKTVQGSCL